MTQLKKLQEEIDRVLKPETAWKAIKVLCDYNIKEMDKKRGLLWRIHDENGEGVLFKIRKKRLVSINNRLPMASINKKKLEKEVGLSYALFNARSEPIGGYRYVITHFPPRC